MLIKGLFKTLLLVFHGPALFKGLLSFVVRGLSSKEIAYMHIHVEYNKHPDLDGFARISLSKALNKINFLLYGSCMMDDS